MEHRYRDYIIKQYLFIALGIFILVKMIASMKIFKEFFLSPLLEWMPSIDSIWIELALVFIMTVTSLSLIWSTNRLKKYIENKIHKVEKRKKIFGTHNFIEGEWFNVTVVNSKKITEYAIIRIDYDGEVGYHISGTIYEVSYPFKNKKIGNFKGIVQKYNECNKELNFSFKRESIYEEKSQNLENHILTLYLQEHYNNLLEEDTELNSIIFSRNKKKCKQANASYGAGKYIFESYPYYKEPNRLHGEFYDPEQDLSMKIRGIKIRTVKEMDSEMNERKTRLSDVEKKYKDYGTIDELYEECRKIKDEYDERNKKRLEYEIKKFNKKYHYGEN